jgi:hypothetical protein
LREKRDKNNPPPRGAVVLMHGWLRVLRAGPYYTIRMAGTGAEKGTIGERLRRRPRAFTVGGGGRAPSAPPRSPPPPADVDRCVRTRRQNRVGLSLRPLLQCVTLSEFETVEAREREIGRGREEGVRGFCLVGGWVRNAPTIASVAPATSLAT